MARRRRWLRTARTLVILVIAAVCAIAVVHTFRSVTGRKGAPHVATEPVTVLSATAHGDDVQVRARLDAPSADGAKSRELEVLVPASTWEITHVLWACYPPADPAKGVLRTPFDPDCTHFVAD